MIEQEKQPEQVQPENNTAPGANDNNSATPETPSVTPAVTPSADPATTEPAATEALAAEPATVETLVTEQAAAPPAKKGFLKKAFNFAAKMGAGALVSYVIQTGIVLGAGLASAPVWATMLISGVSVGAGSTLVHDAFARRDLRKQGGTLTPYFSKAHGKELVSKENRKVFGISTFAALLGSVLYLGFHDGFFQNLFSKPVAPAPVAVTPVPVVAAPPVHVVPHPVVHPAPVALHHVAPVVTPVHCESPLQQFADLIKGHHVSAAVQDAIHRSASTNAHVHAQGVKDLGFYAQNGLGGVPKDTNVALQLFNQSAHEGNKQAMRGMLYLQHYGFDGITANKTASLAAMKSIHHNALAAKFVKAWSVAGKHVPAAKFNADAILKGVKFACGK